MVQLYLHGLNFFNGLFARSMPELTQPRGLNDRSVGNRYATRAVTSRPQTENAKVKSGPNSNAKSAGNPFISGV